MERAMTTHVLRIVVIIACTAVLTVGASNDASSQESGKPAVVTAGNGTGTTHGGHVLGDDGKPLSVTLETTGYPVLILAQLSNLHGENHGPFEGVFAIKEGERDISKSVAGTKGTGQPGAKLDVCLIAL